MAASGSVSCERVGCRTHGRGGGGSGIRDLGLGCGERDIKEIQITTYSSRIWRIIRDSRGRRRKETKSGKRKKPNEIKRILASKRNN